MYEIKFKRKLQRFRNGRFYNLTIPPHIAESFD